MPARAAEDSPNRRDVGVSRPVDSFQLTSDMLERARVFGAEEYVEPGATLFARGSRSADFFVVLDGLIELSGYKQSRLGSKKAVLNRGQFSGELDLLSGRETLQNCRAVRKSRILRIKPEGLRQLLRTDMEIADLIVKGWMARRASLVDLAESGATIVGHALSAETMRMQRFLVRNGYPHRLIDPQTNAAAELLIAGMNLQPEDLPVVFLPDHRILKNPGNEKLAEALGMSNVFDVDSIFDVAVIGAGPSGLAAAVYAASEGLKTIVIEGNAPGGQAGTSSKIENYLGFPTGVTGQELASRAEIQAQRFGARLEISREVVQLRTNGALHELELAGGQLVTARTVVIATGARYRKLGVQDSERFELQNIHYAATPIEAARCRNRAVMIVGGGNSAGQAAIHLSSAARHVHLVCRGRLLGASMSDYLVQRVFSNPRITVHTDSEVQSLSGKDVLEGVTVFHKTRGTKQPYEISEIFVMIGAIPNTGWLQGHVELERNGFVCTGKAAGSNFGTSRPGIYAIGDVRAGSVKRVASAVGEGSAVISDVHRYLEQLSTENGPSSLTLPRLS